MEFPEKTIHRRKWPRNERMHTVVRRDEIAPEELAAQVREMTLKLGAAAATRRLGIGRGALTRLVARLPITTGTLAIVRERLRDENNAASENLADSRRTE